MKRIIGISAVFVLAFCICYSGVIERVRERRDDDHYIREKEWLGLETTNYSPLFVSKEYIRSVMTGTPDLEPTPSDEDIPLADASVILCVSDQNQISLQKTAEARITLTHTCSDGESIPIRTTPNLERWNGAEWERLIYVDQRFILSDDQLVSMLLPGEAVSVPLIFEYSVTKLTPGKYRAVIYVGYAEQSAPYTKLYAEFELTE